MPKLSIIVATYNAKHVLDRCIRSIVDQSSREWELIVVDGGSTDGTVEVIQSNSEHIAYWHSRQDEGIYDAWNEALPHATGEYICFLGADDALRAPETLANIISSIGESRYDLITCRGQLREASGLPGKVIGTSWKEAGLPRLFKICHPGLVHHRSLFKEYGYFNARYKIAADMEFMLRLPGNIQCHDIPMVIVDVQDDGISRNRFWQRIVERREIHSASPQVGPVKAWLYWADKVWRHPIALLLGLPH